MKTLASILGAMVIAASATAGDFYGGFDPDLSVWGGGQSTDAMGLQPGVGDASYTQGSSAARSDLFKSKPADRSAEMTLNSVDNIYGAFGPQ